MLHLMKGSPEKEQAAQREAARKAKLRRDEALHDRHVAYVDRALVMNASQRYRKVCRNGEMALALFQSFAR